MLCGDPTELETIAEEEHLEGKCDGGCGRQLPKFEQIVCDGCLKPLRRGTTRYSCEPCDHDLCHRCAQNSLA